MRAKVRALGLVISFVAALPGCDRECSVSSVVDDFEERGPLKNCGELYSPYPEPDPSERPRWLVAHDCALASLDVRESFFVDLDIVQVDASRSAKLVGGERGDGYEVLWIDSRFSPRSPTTQTTVRCSTLLDAGDCTSLYSNLCLTCVEAVELDSCEYK